MRKPSVSVMRSLPYLYLVIYRIRCHLSHHFLNERFYKSTSILQIFGFENVPMYCG